MKPSKEFEKYFHDKYPCTKTAPVTHFPYWESEYEVWKACADIAKRILRQKIAIDQATLTELSKAFKDL